MNRFSEALEVLLSNPEPGSKEVVVTVGDNVRRAGAVVEAQSIKLRKSSEGGFRGRGNIAFTPTDIDVRITVKGVPGLSIESSIEINGVTKSQTDPLTAEIETFLHTYTFADFKL